MRNLFALAFLTLVTGPAGASNYMAKPVVPVAQRIIHKGVVWNCGPDACQAATDESRPAVLCQGLAKRLGRLDTFLANGRRFTPAELERCNLSARN